MTDRTIHPLPGSRLDAPLDLDSFLPDSVAGPVGECMQRMRAAALKAQTQRLTMDEVRQYSEDSVRVTGLMTDYLSSKECSIKDADARERLIRKGIELQGNSMLLGLVADKAGER